MKQLEYHVHIAGYCRQLEKYAFRGGRRRMAAFPARVVLIRHPEFGWILFDTGYSPCFAEATATFPASLYRKLLPVSCRPAQTAAARLALQGIAPEEIRYIVLSHFHADHIAGARDFPRARFLCLESAWRAVRGRGLRHGFLPRLLPADFERRLIFAGRRTESPLPQFPSAWDLLGDGSLLGIELPGHAPGQLGLFLRAPGRKPVLFAADAAWSRRACLTQSLPPWPIRRLLGLPAAVSLDTLKRLRAVLLAGDVEVRFTHEPVLFPEKKRG